MLKDKCKLCRRAGEKLFLKGERCFSAKCALLRKPYIPGIHGGGTKKAGGRGSRRPSEYGLQLREKQKLKNLYELREKQFASYVEKAIISKTRSSTRLMGLLEARLDNVVFRLGFAVSRSIAKQMVSHGHIMVNGRRSTIPSRQLFKKDVISIRPQSASKGMFVGLDALLKKYNAPVWLSVDKDKKEGIIKGAPVVDEATLGVNVNTIIEFYSR
jgi:small subunit ribosomal protein S4